MSGNPDGGSSELDDIDQAIREGMGTMPADLGLSWASIDDLDDEMLSAFTAEPDDRR